MTRKARTDRGTFTMGKEIEASRSDPSHTIAWCAGDVEVGTNVLREVATTLHLDEVATMSDLQRYIAKRKDRGPGFAKDLELRYPTFKLGAMLCMAREEAGISQGVLANRLRMKKSSIARIENHADEVRLSTLFRYVNVLGRQLHVELVGDPDDGMALREGLRRRLLLQRKAVARGKRGQSFKRLRKKVRE